MEIKNLIDINIHFSTSENVVCIGKSIHNEYFLLVITISNKLFTKKDFDSQNEGKLIIKLDNKYYKIEVTLFTNKISDDKYLFNIFLCFKNSYNNIYQLYKQNKYSIILTKEDKFNYQLYNIPNNIWLASIGYIVGKL
jgi:hypothetical protein